MIKRNNSEGQTVYVAQGAIASIQEAGASSAWHWHPLYVRTFDGKTFELQQRRTRTMTQSTPSEKETHNEIFYPPCWAAHRSFHHAASTGIHLLGTKNMLAQ